ncbi:serine/threonine-protein kinase M1 [Exophiala sideris]|uniref:Serine/threonine-protein kinase MEC1 n=1 Tax=Exophiala sideris TaxID=1016849 RepID=A0ABR0J6V4_9EURO|nr:serine/threonine-protein kinase M1 [Exophiala sideris]KAK5057283.1 serine/threonine-protein kinase M1 [Exophiala sideris]
MAPMLAGRETNGFQPPPSSMLVTHVVHGNGVPDFDRDSFNQLLAEALGSDEQGHSNLGADVSVNHKLICIIFQVGIERALEENPFQTAAVAGKADSQLKTCLEVLQLAIERSPQVLFVKSDSQGSDVPGNCALYTWLIPRLVPLLARGNSGIHDSVLQVFDAMLEADRNCATANPCHAILEYMRATVSAFIAIAPTLSSYETTKTITINADDFSSRLPAVRLRGHVNIPSLSFESIQHLLMAIARILKTISKHSESVQTKVQFWKLFIRFRDYVEYDDSPVDRSEELAHEIRTLNIRPSSKPLPPSVPLVETWPDTDRARKRPRLSTENETGQSDETFHHKVCRRVTLELTGRGVSDLDGLSKTSSGHFQRLSEEKQCAALELLGKAACQLARGPGPAQCRSCDDGISSTDITDEADQKSSEELLTTLLILIQIISRQSKARVVAMSVLRRILMHSSSSADLKLSQTSAGEWCLQSLKSSSRDLRVAAARTLQAYILRRKTVDISLTRENRMTALDVMQTLWQKGDPSIQETLVLALTGMAPVVNDDEELNIILVRLVEYLGHNNPHIVGVVYAEIQRVAQCMQISVYLLFRPFWRTLGIVFAKSLTARPNLAQQLCDLLGMDINGLMGHAAEYALPYLVLQKDLTTIGRFAAANGPSTTPFELCTQRQNLIAILSFLLIQPFADAEHSITAILSEVSAEFTKTDLADWVALDSIQIACELLKAIGDSGQGKSSRIYQALQLLAQLIARQRGQSSGSRRSDGIGLFLENNVLAIVTHFTVLLNDLEAKESKVEKRRCLAALGEVVKLGKSRVVRALPQICACLKSGLDEEDLCDAAFLSWAAMIKSLKRDDFESLVDQTLAIIVNKWDSLSSSSQQEAYDLVGYLLKNHTDLVREHYSTMPSLADIPLLSKFEADLVALKRQMDERHQLIAFVHRLNDENLSVVQRALDELASLLSKKQDLLQRSILREQPDEFVAELTRALLDCCVKFNSATEITRQCGQCLGRIGCLDSSKIENVVDRKSMIVMANFGKADEVIEWIFFFLQHVLVKAFLSAPTTRAQGFLGWAMQEYLKSCERDSPSRSSSENLATRLWERLPESIQNTLTPFLSSKYLVQEVRAPEKSQYPLFHPGMRHRDWLRTIALDFLHRGSGENVDLVFGIACRVIPGQDASIPAFLLPYAVVNLIVSGVEQNSHDIVEEITSILSQSLDGHERRVQEDIKLCSQTVFEILDYMSSWQQQKRRQYNLGVAKSDRGISDLLLGNAAEQIRSIERVLERIPPDILARRALECKSYARALFHWEQHIRKVKADDNQAQLQRLQDIYAQIDEPDGIEGISSRMHVLDIEQQVLEHKKAGRWAAAQSWYEMQLVAKPDDHDVQKNLMDCLTESGQYDVLLHHFDAFSNQDKAPPLILAPHAMEAAWATSQWNRLATYVQDCGIHDFASHLAEIIVTVNNKDEAKALTLVNELYATTAAELTPNAIASFQAGHDVMLKLHVLSDVQLITASSPDDRASVLDNLRARLNILGSNVADKQYLLRVQRAMMSLRPGIFTSDDVAASWLSTARLARKARASSQAFNAVLKASALGDKSAAIEQAKLMWVDGDHRKAIRMLEGAIESGAFSGYGYVIENGSVTQRPQNEIMAKAYVLLGKWLDQAGQTQSDVIRNTFKKATEQHSKLERAHYHLGRFYNRILDSERAMPPGKETQPFLTGETAQLVIENYLRSLVVGSKYVSQTLPKVLTLWLELIDGELPQDPRRGNAQFHAHNAAQRKRVIERTNNHIKKYTGLIQPVLLYTILPQVVARICHANKTVSDLLGAIVVKVVRAFPQQTYWTLLAVIESQQKDRAVKGLGLVTKICVDKDKDKGKDSTPKGPSASELRNMFNSGQKFVKELLRVSDYAIEGKVSKISLSRDLGFNHKIAPSKLVVPIQACLIPSMPTNFDAKALQAFRPFAKEPVTISAFADEALVLSSLQKPRKLTIRGSDGNLYNVLAKPKDDLRKDQRLMEFNTMINRSLKRDVDAAKRRLYIRTYAVIPLNEECGLIEWVDNLKTFRDIILKLYKDKSIQPNYIEIRNLLDESCSGDPEKVKIFPTRVLTKFPEVFHEWFVESFPDPSAWFDARLRYTRSAAVMSIVGHVLGLGDRHGENILFEEDNGGVMHVDFNCLFDKGLTFEKPEMVPFRLTHNMVDAMGAYGYEGPFRRCCEITLRLLRSNEDALMTILETFLHDPTTDFINVAGRKKKSVNGVPNTPVEVLDGVRGKVRGMLPGESVPLGVGGYVEEMIKRATDQANLCRMYIGWCAFF